MCDKILVMHAGTLHPDFHGNLESEWTLAWQPRVDYHDLKAVLRYNR